MLEEWVGDGALSYLVRRELARRYPKLTIHDLVKRHSVVVTNKALTALADRNKFGHGPNKMERRFAATTETNFAQAAAWVADMVSSSDLLRRMDGNELMPDGSMKPSILERRLARAKVRDEAHRIFKEKGLPGLIEAGIVPANKLKRWFSHDNRRAEYYEQDNPGGAAGAGTP